MTLICKNLVRISKILILVESSVTSIKSKVLESYLTLIKFNVESD